MNGCFLTILQMFVEESEVIYRGMCGVIDFVCEKYVVIRLPAVSGYSSPRILVYPENQKEIIVSKDSQK